MEPNALPTSRVSGRLCGQPVDLSQIDYVLGEAELRRAICPSPSPFGSVPPQGERPDVGRIVIDMDPVNDDPKLADTRRVSGEMDGDRAMGCLCQLPSHLATYIRAHVMRDRFNGNNDTEISIDKAVDSAILLGLPSLGDEAIDFAQSRSRVGKTIDFDHRDDLDRVYFSCPVKVGKVSAPNMVLNGRNWREADFGDTIHEVDSDPVWGLYGKRVAEKTSACSLTWQRPIVVHLRTRTRS